MSKIGRKHISTQGVQVQIIGNEIRYQGAKATGIHVLPSILVAQTNSNQLSVIPADQSNKKLSDEVKEQWGLHRALLAGAIAGAREVFERVLKIVGLGFKAILRGDHIEFSLGFSHKINFAVPQGVSVVIDKTGQKITLSSPDRELVGLVASQIRALRKPEPYKGTGIQYEGEAIRRKAGKTKK